MHLVGNDNAIWRGGIWDPRRAGVAAPLAKFFAGNLPGVALDVKAKHTLFQDAAATVPVVADGDPLKVILDQSKRLARSDIITPPAGYGYNWPFTIRRAALRSYTADLNMDDYIVPYTVVYYLSPDGDDSNDGLSAAAPKKSISALVTTLNAAPPTGALLNLAPGTYDGADSLQGMNIAFPCNLVCEVGQAILTTTQAATWAKVGGRTNLYVATVTTTSGTPVSVVDLSNVDDFGNAIRLRNVADADEGDVTPNSVYSTSTQIVIHTHDGRAPDSDIVVLGRDGFGWQQTTAVDIFMRGVEFWGPTQPAFIDTSATAATYAFDRCKFLYSRASANGFETGTSSPAGMLTLLNRCDAAYNSFDGFGYRGAHNAIEVACRGVWNGYTRANDNDNGSTTHGSVVSLRVNGTYRFNDDRNIHDINTTRNLLIGCVAGDAQNADTDGFDNAAFLNGVAGSSSVQWLEGCTSTGGVVADVGAAGAAITYLTECDGLDSVLTLDTATISDLARIYVLGNHLKLDNAVYREAGDAAWLEANGTSTFGVTPSIDLSAYDEVNVFVAVRKESDAAAAFAVEFSASATSNPGTFWVSAPNSAAANFSFRSRGSAAATALSAGFASPVSAAIVGRGKISTDTSTLRVDGTQVAASETDQGAGNFGNYPLYVGARGGVSNFLAGRVAMVMVVPGAMSAGLLADAEAITISRTP